MFRNRWPEWSGMGGRNGAEWVAEIKRNIHPGKVNSNPKLPRGPLWDRKAYTRRPMNTVGRASKVSTTIRTCLLPLKS